MAAQGNIIDPSTPDVAAQFFKSELVKYADLVRKANVKID
jgi:hypothetical protein